MSEHVTPEQLLGHRAWLHALARSLVRGAADADDLVQDTWVAALRRPPRPGPDLKAWLRTVLVNRFRERHRRGMRAAARERAAARSECVPATAEVVERAELQTLLGRLVLELAEQDREVLLLHFFDGRSTREIAHRLDIPHETVRTRLRRALERLRGRLDAAFRRDGRDWRPVLLPLIDSPDPPAPIAPVTWLAAGVGLMTSKLAVGTAALCALALLAVVFLSGEDGPTGTARESSGPAAVAPPNESPSARTLEKTRGSARSAVSQPVADETSPGRDDVASTTHAPRLLVRVQFTGLDPSFAGDVHVRLFGISDPIGRGDEEVESSGPPASGLEIDASRLLDSIAPSQIALDVDHPRYLPVRTRAALPRSGSAEDAPRVIDVTIPLERARFAVGRVEDHEGRPVAGAIVAGFPIRGGRRRPARAPSVATDAAGRFRMRISADAEQILLVCGDLGAPAARRIDIGSDTEVDVGELRLGPNLRVRGAVRGANATPYRGATVAADLAAKGTRLKIGPHELTWDGERARRASVRVECDEQGEFRLEGLSESPYRLKLWLEDAAPDVGDALARVVTAPADGVDFVVAGATLIVEGLRDGRPAAGHRLTIRSENAAGVIRLDDNGRGSQLCTPGHRYRISAAYPGYEEFVQDVTIPGAGETLLVHFDLRPQDRPARLRLAFADEPPSDLEYVLLWLTPVDAAESGEATLALAARLTDGDFLSTPIPAGRYRVRSRPDASSPFSAGFFADVETEVDIPYGATDPVVVNVAMVPAGRLRVALHRPDGSSVSADATIRDSDGRRVAFTSAVRGIDTMTTDENRFLRGVNDLVPALRPGRYTIEIRSDDIRPASFQVEIRAGAMTAIRHEVTPR